MIIALEAVVALIADVVQPEIGIPLTILLIGYLAYTGKIK